jgi:hypothetical protein
LPTIPSDSRSAKSAESWGMPELSRRADLMPLTGAGTFIDDVRVGTLRAFGGKPDLRPVAHLKGR